MKLRLRFLAVLLGCLTGAGAQARADFVITVGNATVAAGGTTTLDVLIRGTGTAGDPLSSFGFEFQITPTGPRHLDFRNPQLDAQLTSPNYVFAGNSADLTDGTAVGVVHSVSGGTNNQFVGGDDTNTGGDVIVKGNVLLARLNLTAATTSAPVAGDTFTVSLVSGPFTGFRSATGALTPFTATAGLVTVTAVPEPSSTVLTLSGLALVAAFTARSRRRARGADSDGSH